MTTHYQARERKSSRLTATMGNGHDLAAVYSSCGGGGGTWLLLLVAG